MPPKGYLSGPDLAAQRAMWDEAAKASKDASGVAIDTGERDARGVLIDKRAQEDTGAGRQEGEVRKTMESGALRAAERGGEAGRDRAGLQERLRQLQKDLREDEAAIAYNEMQISALQQSLTSTNRGQLEMQITGFEHDKTMRIQRAAGYRRQIGEINDRLRQTEGRPTLEAAAA